MLKRPIGVGIIGVNPERGWATTAHLPALQALSGYSLTAVSTSSDTSARAARKALDIDLAFGDYRALLARPEVDLVVVTVKAPMHLEIVTAALDAGKAVYCEWPLGANLAQAITMTTSASQKGVATVVGLQARQSPALEYARDLIAAGYVGTVLSTTIVGSSVPGSGIAQANAYMLDTASGANALTVAGGHSLDALTFVLGPFTSMSAVLGTQRTTITLQETGEQRVKSAPDHIAVIGRLESGAIVAAHFREGLVRADGLHWEINGTEGTLTLTADADLPEIYPLTVTAVLADAVLRDLPVPARYAQKWPELEHLVGSPAYNVARTYAAFAQDLHEGTHTAPTFAQALNTHRLIATIQAAAANGTKPLAS